MNILVLGNGYDLAHNLKTRYTDFLDFCKHYSNEELISKQVDHQDEFLSFINKNIWLKYFNNQMPNLIQHRNWIDFEKEVADIVNDLNKYDPNIIKISENLINLQLNNRIITDKLKHFLSVFCYRIHQKRYKILIETNVITNTNLFIDFLYDQLRNFARAFELYCLKINNLLVQQCKSNQINFQKLKITDFNHVLSLNYTDTYKLLYDNDKTKYCYIHGKAQDKIDQTNIIFGIDDNLPIDKASSEFKWIKFKKYYQRIKFKTGAEYKDWLIIQEQYKTSRNFIHIVGHSFGKTDYDVLYELFHNEGSRIIVYYYSPDDYDEKIQSVINLLAYKDANGRDKLIKRVHGNDWTIKFVDQYDENEGLFFPKK
jgi:hypothetical protein